MTSEKIEIVWPDKSFAQFGGHVMERLFETKKEMSKLKDMRYRVRVTIETFPLGAGSQEPGAGEDADG